MTKTYFIQYYKKANWNIESTIIDVIGNGEYLPSKEDIENTLDKYNIPINNIVNISLLN